MEKIPSFAQFKSRFESQGSRLIVMTPFGRGGVYFLQSLFDNHPEVLMYPGNFDYYNRVILSRPDWQSNWKQALYDTFDFIPKAVHMNIHVKLDVPALMRMTEEALEGQPFDSRTLFLAAHYAVGRFMKRDLNAIGFIVLHDHHHPVSGETEAAIRKDFPDSSFLYTVRDPRSNYYAQRKVKKVLMASPGFEIKFQHFMTVTCVGLYQHGLHLLNRFPGKAWIIRLEDIQAEKETYMRALANRLGVTFDPCLLQTTFGGIEWGGDAASTKPQPGFRKSADPKLWQNGLNPIRVAALEILLHEEIKALGYKPIHGPWSIYHWLAILFLPLWKYEDFDVLFSREYFRYQSALRVPAWKVILRDALLYVRTELGLLRRLFKQPPSYPGIPNTIFRSA